MKYKIMKISIFILLLAILLPNQIFASSGYEIERFHIDMKVNEDNTFDITETMVVNFTSYGKHGIFRKIPLGNTVERLDGTKSNNRAKITNISVNDEFKTYNESGYKVIKIGNASKKVSGRKTYTIKYTYNIGKDPLKNADELYFNLIGNEWDTSINNVSFTITMPKSFDKTKLGVSTGYRYSTNSSSVNYNVVGNIIKGSVNTKLYSGQGVTVRIALPDGYFVGASSNFDYMMLLQISISIACVVIAVVLWKKYGKDEIVVETLEFYPPEGLNSADIGFLYKGHSEEKDIISLLIYLANKGYLKIKTYEEKTLKIIKTTNFKIIKEKEYDGDNENERIFFNELFEFKNEVTKSDLQNKFYLTLKNISKNIDNEESQEKIFEQVSLKESKKIFTMIGVVFINLVLNSSLLLEGGILDTLKIYIIMLPVMFIPIVTCIYKSHSRTTKIALILMGTVILMFLTIPNLYFENMLVYTINIICLDILLFMLGIIKKRTEYGSKILGRIKGFKNFLEMVEKPRLEKLVMEDPEYFYNILPYTYVLDISDKWMKKFEDIALKEPYWYNGDTSFNVRSFNSSMNLTYSSISNAMSSNPSSSRGFGGGFSGGGSGGGGGGSW